MNQRRPRVTVLMPVYNCERYLKEAIDSILMQSYRDYEFIIINDGSTDRTAEILKLYSDERIRIIHHEKNIGLPSVLNKAIELSVGEYIVRMDADDISLPTRIEKQLRFMDDHPDVGICGTWIKYIGAPWRPWRVQIYKYPIKHRDIKARMLFRSMLAHPAVMMRRSLLNRFQLRYESEYFPSEDWLFWKRSSFCFSLSNLPEVLLLYRVHPESITHTKKEREFETVKRINRLHFQALGMDFSPEELLLYWHYSMDFEIEVLIRFHSWLKKVQEANVLKNIYPEPELSQALAEEWVSACWRSSGMGIDVWFLFWRLPFGRLARPSLGQIIRFFLRCLMKWRPGGGVL
ncbi:MAG: glycosyltransferase [Candidatus Omnitrophica bacterium]|nr:glycosyltransferase [Candidatus Omnitrophota bacterium]